MFTQRTPLQRPKILQDETFFCWIHSTGYAKSASLLKRNTWPPRMAFMENSSNVSDSKILGNLISAVIITLIRKFKAATCCGCWSYR